MASHIENEMTSCLSEMEHLQAKMMELQETKKSQEAEQEEKSNNVEPNLAVMEKWLKSVIGERENVKEAQRRHETPSQHTSREERSIILQNYQKYFNRRLKEWRPPVPEITFQGRMGASQFMIDYIEATHNLLKIQQECIDELGAKLEKLAS